MKRLSTSIAALALGTFFIASVSFAGINYNQYREDFQKQKGSQNEQKSFEHKSPTQREQPGEMKSPQKETKSSLPPEKYDRHNWDPNH